MLPSIHGILETSMKKLLCLMIVAAMSFVVVGCGEPAADPKAEVNPTANEPMTNPAPNAGTKNTQNENAKNAVTDIGISEDN